MGNSLTHRNSITPQAIRKALMRTHLYRELQLRVSQRLRVSRPTVSKAASGKFVGRYRRVEVALLEELARFEPEVTELVERLKKNHVA